MDNPYIYNKERNPGLYTAVDKIKDRLTAIENLYDDLRFRFENHQKSNVGDNTDIKRHQERLNESLSLLHEKVDTLLKEKSLFSLFGAPEIKAQISDKQRNALFARMRDFGIKGDSAKNLLRVLLKSDHVHLASAENASKVLDMLNFD